MRHIVNFSGGLCSFWAARRVVDRHGSDNVTLLFADTMMEDKDLYRFNQDAGELLGVPITRVADGRTPWQVFCDQGMIGTSRIPICTKALKKRILDQWRRQNRTPEDSIFYLGIDWTEAHRMDGDSQRLGMRKAFLPWRVESPMMEEPFWDKARMQQEWVQLGKQLPRLYAMGFPHNNCGGFCVKAGHAHFAHLLKKMPERYAWHEAQEESLRAQVGDYSVLNDRRGGGPRRTFTLRTLREMIERGERHYDEHDWGGCGCSVDSNEDPETLDKPTGTLSPGKSFPSDSVLPGHADTIP